jgi:hypothetical protein
LSGFVDVAPIEVMALIRSDFSSPINISSITVARYAVADDIMARITNNIKDDRDLNTDSTMIRVLRFQSFFADVPGEARISPVVVIMFSISQPVACLVFLR